MVPEQCQGVIICNIYEYQVKNIVFYFLAFCRGIAATVIYISSDEARNRENPGREVLKVDPFQVHPHFCNSGSGNPGPDCSLFFHIVTIRGVSLREDPEDRIFLVRVDRDLESGSASGPDSTLPDLPDRVFVVSCHRGSPFQCSYTRRFCLFAVFSFKLFPAGRHPGGSSSIPH